MVLIEGLSTLEYSDTGPEYMFRTAGLRKSRWNSSCFLGKKKNSDIMTARLDVTSGHMVIYL